MKGEHRVLDFIAAWLSVFDVDWDSDFESDGYTDILGRDVEEDFFFADDVKQQEQSDEIENNYIHIAANQ